MKRHQVSRFRQARSYLAILGVVSAILPPASSPAQSQTDRTTVTVTGGRVQGSVVDGILTFKGIPFAAPPVGQLRWRAPQPVRSWIGVLPTTTFAPDCMQKVDRSGSNVGIPLLRTEPSEDCLYLNVWRPSQPTSRPLPVMVWIYGGGFSVGGTSPILFQGDELARQGVIVVSFNYRLGRFGFFAHPQLTKEHPDEPKANYAYMDQIAALKWVQRNIAAFGGDPGNVTIFGESAGGVAVDAMLVSPLARGLFHKAIVQSGPTHGMTIREMDKDQPGRSSLEKFGVAIAAANGIAPDDPKALERLRGLPASALIDLTRGLPDGGDRSRTVWGGPTMDGKILPVIKGDYFRQGLFARVPVLVGANSDDVTASTGVYSPRPIDYTLARFGSRAPEALRIYDPDGTQDATAIRHKVAADEHMIEPARFIATEVDKWGGTAYRYYFSYVPEAMLDRWTFGAPHGGELAFVFNVLRTNYGPAWSEQDLKVAKTVSAYWVNFAKFSNPNGPGLPEWPPYHPAGDFVMHFMKNGAAAAVEDPLRARLDLAADVAEPRRDPSHPAPERRPEWPHFEPLK